MAQSAIFARPQRQPAPVFSRVVPGCAANVSRLRKPPSSVGLDGTQPGPLPFSAPQAHAHRELARAAFELILPRPLVQGRPGHLWNEVAIDFFVSFFTITAVSWLFSTRAPQYLADIPWVAVPELRNRIGLGLIYSSLITLLAYSEGVYSEGSKSRDTRISLLRAICTSSAVLWLALPSWQFSVTSGIAMIWSAVASIAALQAARTWRSCLAAADLRSGRRVRNVLIAGPGKRGRDLARYFQEHPELRTSVKGFLGHSRGNGDNVLGEVWDLPRIARTKFVDEVIMTDVEDAQERQELVRLAHQNRLDVAVVPEFFGLQPSNPRLEQFGGTAIMPLFEQPLPSFQLAAKRAIDLVVAFTVLLVLAPALVMVACMIKIDSAGPVLYSAERVGCKGCRFRCHKFRTMVNGADSEKETLRALNQRQGPFFKIENDPRVTRIGAFLRRYSIDEWPQLFNVLKGELSLVGPRPHPVDDVRRYELGHLRRLDVSPGITGLWQITSRQDPSFQKSLALDLHYIENWSLWLDFKILMKTLPVVLAGTGS